MSEKVLHEWDGGEWKFRLVSKNDGTFALEFRGSTSNRCDYGTFLALEIARLVEETERLRDALRYAHDHLALDHEGPDGEPDWLLKKIRAALEEKS